MLIACDVDGVISSFPDQFAIVLRALRVAGNRIVIVHGIYADTATQDDCHATLEQLNALGMGDCWDSIYCVPRPIAPNKAAELEAMGADVLIDNRVKNLKAAADAGIPLCLLPWQTQE